VSANREGWPPILLLLLWLYATIDVGVGARTGAACPSDAAYRRLAGGAPLTYHGVADFRVDSVRVDSARSSIGC
jgi:hypothetical protein